MKAFKLSQALLAVAASPASPTMASRSLLHTPPMGFNNWARVECALNQSLFITTADAMVANGLLDAGYDRINIDDCWPTHSRSANGSLVWNITLFPDGLVYLGEYVKSRGFHFGIYSDAGNETCGGYPGSLGYEEIDAVTFQQWGIDYLKLDGCNVFPSTEATYKDIYSHWHQVISNMSHPLIFSESSPAYFAPTPGANNNNTDWYTVMDWVPQYGELARHSDDIPTYGESKPWEGILRNYGFEVLLARYQLPGYFNDPDFLIVDHPNLTMIEKATQFALWCSFSAPLIISAWIPGLSVETLEFLTNKDLINVDQDSLALQATLVARNQNGSIDILTKSLENNDRLLTVFNRGSKATTINVSFGSIGYNCDSNETFTVKDLWSGINSTIQGRDGVKLVIESHGTNVTRISTSDGCLKNISPTGIIFNTASLHCLTLNGTEIRWQNCTGSDDQIWKVGADGSISNVGTFLNLSMNGTAMTNGAGEHQKWKYSFTGNIVGRETGGCLTEDASGSVLIEECGFERNDQVFEMPSGSVQLLGSTIDRW